MAKSELECFSVVKTTHNSRREGEIERKKHDNVKLKEVTPRKTRRMQIRVPSEFNFKLAFRRKRTYQLRWIRLAFGIL